MCNTTFFWTIGTYFIQKDGRHSATIDFRDSLRKIFSPPLLGFIIGVILVLLNIQLPAFLLSDFQYLGNLTIPLSMIFIGISVANAGLSRLRFSEDNVLVLLGRFVVAPLLMMVIVSHTQMPLLMKQVFIIQSAMPVMTKRPRCRKTLRSRRRLRSYYGDRINPSHHAHRPNFDVFSELFIMIKWHFQHNGSVFSTQKA